MVCELATELMEEFARATGVAGQLPQRRYLWTDAFAVCNFLGLHRAAGQTHWLEWATNLVGQVHNILGRHRPDDLRSGWISGLSEAEGTRHPTRGGLRIGKKLNERTPSEPVDPQLEWDQDGQYFHYLTKWMHALCRVYQETHSRDYLEWAVELAVVAHRRFAYELSPGGPKRMFWKMSIDLTRPLVYSMGHHDPLDGLVTSLEVRALERGTGASESGLDAAISDFAAMCSRSNWATEDPLGIGGLLDDAFRLTEMLGCYGAECRNLLVELLVDIRNSLRAFLISPSFNRPADYRLPFRELGLSIGLHAIPRMVSQLEPDGQLSTVVQELLPYESLCRGIEEYWSQPQHRTAKTWVEHSDINAVMLATSLAPQGYLGV